MIVQCAACQARFKIADDKVTERGVKVRCRKCSTVFIVHKDSAPAPDAPPLGLVSEGVTRPSIPMPVPPAARPELALDDDLPTRPAMAMPVPPAAAPPRAAPPLQASPRPSAPSGFGPQRPAAAAPSPLPPSDPFRRFQTNDFSGSSDPFKATQPLPPQDPFAGLAPAKPAAAPPPAPVDPFANLGPQKPAAAPAPVDPFANLGPQKPAAAPARPAPEAADPFASLELGKPIAAPAAQESFSPAPPRPPPQPRPQPQPLPQLKDPFAGLEMEAPTPAPAPAARAPLGGGDPFGALEFGDQATQPNAQIAPAAAQAHADDPFANIDVGVPASPGPALDLRAGAPAAIDLRATAKSGQMPPIEDLFGKPGVPSSPPGPAARPPGGDPFAHLSLGAAPSVPPGPAMPAVPAALDLGAIDLSPPDPMGLGPEPSLPPKPPPPEAEPRTAVRSISWKGGDQSPDVKSPAAVYAAKLLTQKQAGRPRRSLILSLLSAVVFLAIAGLVVERTARAIQAAKTGPSVAAGKLSVRDLSSSYYLNAEGRPVFLVRGAAVNPTTKPVEPAVKVTIELRRGDSVERTAEAYAGRTPMLEEIYSASGPLDLAEVTQRVASKAAPLEPMGSAEFLVVFSEYPEDLPDLTLRAVAAAAAPPPAPAPAAPKVEEAPPAPAPAPVEPAKAGARPGKADAPKGALPPPPVPARPEPAAAPPAKATEFPMDDPKRPAAAPRPDAGVAPSPTPKPVEAAKPAPVTTPKPLEFPMDDPPKMLKVNSGQPAPKKTP